MEGLQYMKPEHLTSYQPQLTQLFPSPSLVFLRLNTKSSFTVGLWFPFPDEEAHVVRGG